MNEMTSDSVPQSPPLRSSTGLHSTNGVGPTLFLTGATGFLGGQILVRLLTRTDRHISCLVRAADSAAATERGEARLKALLGRAPTSSEHHRVRWVHGDLLQKNMGLDESELDGLSTGVTEIIHCAADVKFHTPPADAHRTNVGGVEAVCDFARRCLPSGFRRLHHISTAFVAGRRAGRIVAGFLPPDDLRSFRNAYEWSKANGERHLLRREAIPHTVYRPSIVIGDSRTGWTESFNVLYDPMRQMADDRLPMLPCGGRALLDCVPVDHVADAVLALGARDDTLGQTLHLTAGAETIDVGEFAGQTSRGIARRSGGPGRLRTRLVPRARWTAMRRVAQILARAPLPKSQLSKVIRIADRQFSEFAMFEQYGWVGTEFDNHRETELLHQCGVELEGVQHWFPRIVDHALAVDFGRGTTRPAKSVSDALDEPSPPKHGRDIGYQVGLLSFVRPMNVIRMAGYATAAHPSRLGRMGFLMGSGSAGVPLHMLERHRFGEELDRVEVTAPIFIIGHWRSGTTHLHNLLSRDHRFGYLSMYQALAPDFSLTSERWARPLLQRAMPLRRPMDNMVWPLDAPQEEEIPLAKTAGHSFYLQFLFPQNSEELFRRFVLFEGDESGRRAEKWDAAYRELLRTATLRSGGRRLVLKNPVNTARIQRLLELYPDARFIHIHRNPYDVFVSACHLHRQTLRLTSLQLVDEDVIRSNVLALYELTMRRYLEDRALIPEGRLQQTTYDQLVGNPIPTLERIYSGLGIPDFESVRPAIESYTESLSSYQRNRFDLADGDMEAVSRRWAFAFEEFGYETSPHHRDETAVASSDAHGAPGEFALEVS